MSGRHLQVFFSPDTGAVRLGLSVPRRFGTAPSRNRVRRRLREIFRRNRGAFRGRGGRLVVNVRPSAAAAPFQELSGDFLSAVARALARTAAPR
jgi:ribonuclease P protein component